MTAAPEPSASAADAVRLALIELAGLPADFSATAHLYHELGVSSVDAMQLLVTLEEQFGVTIPDEDFVDATTAETLTALLLRLSGRAS